MPQDRNLTETAAVEREAQALVQSEIQTAAGSSGSTDPDEQVSPSPAPESTSSGSSTSPTSSESSTSSTTESLTEKAESPAGRRGNSRSQNPRGSGPRSAGNDNDNDNGNGNRNATGNARGRDRDRGRGRRPRQVYGDPAVPRVQTEVRRGGVAHSRAYLKNDLTLYSDRAQIFFERNYENVNFSLILSTLVVEAIGGVTLAEEVSQKIESQFKELEQKMKSAIQELKRGATEMGIPPALQVPSYDHKRRYSPPLHTPHSAQFMTVVELFDRIVARAEGAWINRKMDAKTRQEVVNGWERRLVKFVRELYAFRQRSMEEARKIGFGRRAAAIENSVRREQNEEPLQKLDVATTEADERPTDIQSAEVAPELTAATSDDKDSAAATEQVAEPAPNAEASPEIQPQSELPEADEVAANERSVTVKG